jgi:hypothetical protein
MNNINKGIAMTQILEFDVVFPDEDPLTITEYLKGGSRDLILNVAAHFLGFKTTKSDYSNDKLLSVIFCTENEQFADDVKKIVRNIENKGVEIVIVNPYSSLKLFESYFEKEDSEETQTIAEFERNLFKAYLLINSEFSKRQTKAFESTENLEEDLKMPMRLFCSQFPISDKMNVDIQHVWVSQLMKAAYLFEFLENDTRTVPLLNAFLRHFSVDSWQEYLKSFIPLSIPAIKNENETFTDITVDKNGEFNENCEFLEKLCVQIEDEFSNYDFLTLRSKPFYKIEEGKYRIISNLFVVEKIFKGMYFLLRDINEMLPKGDKITELKSLLGLEFSEKVLFYKIIEIIYPCSCIRFSGDELDKMGIDGAPDYYLRKGKNIMLFESKDFLIRADKKLSFDYETYEEEFERILYYKVNSKGKEKFKAVMQLICSIRRILKREFKADIDYRYRDVFIYPILISHDHQFDVPGFNTLINSWFQDELEQLKEEGLFIHNVKPLVVVNVDTLLFHQNGLSKDFQLHDVICSYEKQIEIKLGNKQEKPYADFSKFNSFSYYLNEIFIKRGCYRIPPIVETVAPLLFKDEFVSE